MELKDFIGKVVICKISGKRYVVDRITASEFAVLTEKPGPSGYHACYCWETINGDPISKGDLVFEDASLTEPFKAAYKAYWQTEEARWESYGYWLNKSY